LVKLPSTTSETELLKNKRLNEDDNIDGFYSQLPLPEQIDEQKY
jgi:5,10-methylene-tetrahydrofolate dehydrogenase/methenyl tetrahydrofolate cyclohydrolase